MTIHLGSQYIGTHGILRCSIERQSGAFGAEERMLLQIIAPHVAQAWHAATSNEKPFVTAPTSPDLTVDRSDVRSGGLELRGDQSVSRLLALGLTRREAEVMIWVSQGKTSAEVAMILNSTTGTVNKHLEHIFTKLNVETRTAAAAIVLDALR